MLEANLERARDCYRRQAWTEAHQLFLLADDSEPLAAEDLELAASSAYLVGRDRDFQQLLERAHHAWLNQDDPCHAARSAFWVGLTLLFQGDAGPGSGWLARAHRLVEGRQCVEHGYLLLPVAEQRLGERNSAAALTAAAGAAEMGRQFEDADLTACAQHLQGRALIQQGRVEPGFQLLDEAMVAVSGGELSPIMTGLLYCSVIAVCQQVFALGRAREWTFALSRWCERQPQMAAFTGSCLVHRAEVMQFRGAWAEAMAQACQAGERVSRAGEKAQGAAFYRQGEIHRLRGEFAAAERVFRNASRLGTEPQPGLALLRMNQGRFDSACAAIRRILAATGDPLDKARLLPAHVEIARAAGDLQEARVGAAELDEIAHLFPTDILQAMAAQAQGAVELAEGRALAASKHLRRAFELWQRVEAPYESACVRLLLAQACRELGDLESASLEFEAARALFDSLGAAPDLARLDSLRDGATQPHQHGLTARELQVLRRIAAGKTNKAIATELFLSERTIDRHVSNLLNKLGVSSRAAATAFAYSHKLF